MTTLKDNKAITVTALVPNYNGGEFLKLALESLVAQSYQPLKITVLDDGSTDGSADGLDQIYAGVEVIRHMKNRGKAAVLNEAFVSCESDYIILHDSDDVSHPDRVARQVQFMAAHPDLGCSCSFVNYVSAGGRKIGKGVLDLRSPEKLETYLRGEDPFGLFCPSVILKTKVVRNPDFGFRGRFWPADDIDLWNRIAEAGWGVQVQPDYLVDYRIHGSSAVTSNFWKTRLQFEWVRLCLRERRMGRVEPDLDAFQTWWESASITRKINRWRKIRAKGFYRATGFAVAERRFGKACILALVALILQPIYFLRRLFHQKS